MKNKKPIFQNDHIYFLKEKEVVELETSKDGLILSAAPVKPKNFVGVIAAVGQDCKKGFKPGMEVQVPMTALSQPIEVLGVEYISCNEKMVTCTFTLEENSNATL